MKVTAHLDPSPLFWSPRRAKLSKYLAQWSTRSCRTLMKMWNPSEISWPRPPLRFIILSPHVCSLPPQKYTTSSTSGTSPRYVLVDCNLKTIHILPYCSHRFSKVCCEPTRNTMILKMQWGDYGFMSVSECSQIALLGRRIMKPLCLSFLRSWDPCLTLPTITSALADNLPYLVSTLIMQVLDYSFDYIDHLILN